MARCSQPSSSGAAHAPSAWTLKEGDCLQGLAGLADGSVDIVITDPPYESEAHTPDRMVARAGGRLECEPIAFPPITEEQRTESARHMARLARRWILVFCQVEGAMKWRAALEAGGAVYKRTCQWIKPDGKPQYSGDRPGKRGARSQSAPASGSSRTESPSTPATAPASATNQSSPATPPAAAPGTAAAPTASSS